VTATQVGTEATVGEGGNFTPATEPPTVNPVTRLRAAGDKAREDHYRRMAWASDFVIALIRPRWVIILGLTSTTERKTDRWQMAANVAFAFLLLLVSALIARGVLGNPPLMALAAYVVTVGVLKLVRVQLARPYAGDEGSEA
jgi:fatty acid desaturase